MSSIEGIANISAFIAAFLLTPEIHLRTVGFIIRIAEQRYGLIGFDVPVSLAWLGTVGLLTFFLSRATLATAIVAGGLAIATRFV